MKLKSEDKFLYPEKEKSTAVIIAVVLGFWTWLYTYRIDKFKFWLSVILTLMTIGLFWFIAWVWAIIETVNRPKVFFDNFSEYHINSTTPITIEGNNSVKNYKLNILLSEIAKRKKYVLVFSSNIFIYVIKIFYLLFYWSIIFVIVAILEAEYVHTFTGISLLTGSAILSIISTLILVYKFKIENPAFIEKRKMSNLDLLNDCLNDLEKEFPYVISDFGGMASFKKYFK